MMKQYEKYKDTEYDWLLKVPHHWQERSIRSICSLSEERNRERTDLELLSVYREYGVIRKVSRDDNHNTESINLSNYKYVGINYLVMNKMKMWQGSLGISIYEGIVSPAYIVCSIKENTVLPSYLNYLLRSTKFKTHYNRISYGIRVGQWDMRYDDFKSLKLYIPLPTEQEQIVRYLDWKVAMAEKFVREKKHEIELLKEQIETLCYGGDTDDRVIITQWCPDTPSNWRKVLAKRIFEERKEKNCINEEMLAVTQDRGVVYKSDCSQNYVTAENTSTQKLVKQEDFVISLRSFQGGIEYSKIQGIVSPAYNVFYLKEKYNYHSLQAYYRFLFKSKAFIALLYSMGGGIRDGKNISFSDFSQIELPLPPKDVSDEILRLSHIYDSLNAYLSRTIKLINEYKAQLISDVTTGKVDVRGIEIPDYPKEETTVTEDDNEENNE